MKSSQVIQTLKWNGNRWSAYRDRKDYARNAEASEQNETTLRLQERLKFVEDKRNDEAQRPEASKQVRGRNAHETKEGT